MTMRGQAAVVFTTVEDMATVRLALDELRLSYADDARRGTCTKANAEHMATVLERLKKEFTP